MQKVNLEVGLDVNWPEAVMPALELANALEVYVDQIRRLAYSSASNMEGELLSRFGTVKWKCEVLSNGKGESTAGADSGQPTVDPVEGVDGVRDGAGHADVEERAGASERQGPDETSGSDGEERD